MIPLGVLASGYVAPAGGSFSPDDISGLAMWFAADEITGLSDGDPITTWDDLTTNDNDATSGANTTYETGEFGSLPGVAFGSNNGFNIPLGLIRNLPGVTVFAVVKLNSSAAAVANLVYITRPTSDSAVWVQFYRNNTTLGLGGRRLDTDAWDNTTSAAGVLSNDTPLLLTACMDWSNAETFANVNGTQVLADSSFQTAGMSADANASLARLGVGKASNGLNGFVGEILLYQSALSAPDRADVESYLMTKWGIS